MESDEYSEYASSEYGEAYEMLRTAWERQLRREAVAVLDRNRVERVRHTFNEAQQAA